MTAATAQPRTPGERTWGESFEAVYAEACSKHENVLRLPDPIVDELATKLDARQQTYIAGMSTLARTLVLIAIVAVPWLYLLDGWWKRHQGMVEQWVSNVIGPVGRPDWRYVAAIVLIPILWLVFLWTPLRKNPLAPIVLLGMRPSRTSFWNIWNIGFSWLVCMFLVGVGQVAWDSRTKTMSAIFAAGVASALLWVAAMIIVVPVMYLVMRILVALDSGMERDAGVQLLAQEFLKMLLRLDDITDLALLTRSERRNLVDSLVRVSRTMSQLHDLRPDSASEWARLQMHLASQNVLRLASWLYFPQAGTLAALKEEMIRYANVLLSGNLHELPRDEVGELQGLRIVEREIVGWRRALLHLGMVLYFVLPLAVAGLLIAVFHLESRASGPMQIIAGLVYLIWALAGLVSFMRYLGPDARMLVSDVFKAYFGKK